MSKYEAGGLSVVVQSKKHFVSMPKQANSPSFKPVIGWREWVSLKNLSTRKIRAKIDTGAKTSSLHAEDFEIVRRGRKAVVYFDMFLDEKTNRTTRVHAPLIEERWVKDTGGKQTLRPVIPAQIRMGDYVWEIEVTLNNRSRMKHEFLLGKDAIKGRFLVDVASSYKIGKKLKKKVAR